MQESRDICEAYAGFADRLSAGDVARFDDYVAREAKLIVGTAPGEHVRDRAAMRFGFETEGVSLTPDAPEAWEEGDAGWLFDTPRFGFPDGSAMSTRVSMVVRREAGRWKIVHAHFSVGVPDEEVVDLQRRWT